MRFGTFRNAYRSATRHFGSDVRYRRFYSITPPRNSISAVLPYLYTRTNPVTLRLEDQATDGSSSNLRQLFATSMSGGGSSLFSPASEMSALERARGGGATPGGVLLSVDAYQFLIMTLTEQYVIGTPLKPP